MIMPPGTGFELQEIARACFAWLGEELHGVRVRDVVKPDLDRDIWIEKTKVAEISEYAGMPPSKAAEAIADALIPRIRAIVAEMYTMHGLDWDSELLMTVPERASVPSELLAGLGIHVISSAVSGITVMLSSGVDLKNRCHLFAVRVAFAVRQCPARAVARERGIRILAEREEMECADA